MYESIIKNWAEIIKVCGYLGATGWGAIKAYKFYQKVYTPIKKFLHNQDKIAGIEQNKVRIKCLVELSDTPFFENDANAMRFAIGPSP